MCFQVIWAQESKPIDILVISDLNGSYGSTSYSPETHNATAHILSQRPDLVLVTGDMVAGQKENLPYNEMWEAFHRAVTLPLKEDRIPIAVSPGNHDASGYRKYQEERDIFVDQWKEHKPNLAYIDDTNYPLYYAFMVEDVLLISLDNTLLGGLQKKQKRWLDMMLSMPAKQKIVYGHLPLFPFAEGRGNESLMDFELEEILLRHNVDLFLSGHHHTYYPGYHNSIRYVSTPCLGSGPRFLMGATERSKKGLVRIRIANNKIEVEGLNAREQFSIIPKSSLPSFIEYSGILIWRDDLALDIFSEKID